MENEDVVTPKAKTLEYYIADCKRLKSEMHEQEDALRIKRRWLMDLPLSGREEKRMKKINPFLAMSVPETLLREDDLYYDKIRTFVERGFGVHHSLKYQHMIEQNFRSLDSCDHLSMLSLLDEMTNKGLFSFAELVTAGMVEYEKTRSKMKKIIKQYLVAFIAEKHSDYQMRMEKITSLLKDPQSFLGNHARLCTPTESFRAAAIRVLDRLEELPFQALKAMNRKLKGVRVSIPKLDIVRTTASRKHDVIPVVRNRCLRMLLELDEGKEPQEALAKALAVAGLTFKLILGHPTETEFQKFSPEIEALQNDIAKAISLSFVDNHVPIADIEAIIKKLRHPSDPEVDLKKKALRFALRNLLLDYLFECSDMDIIPESLLEVLFDINKGSQAWSCRSALMKEVEEEVEFLLCLSAQTKQIVWDSLQKELDEDFANVYMEELEESDDDGEEEVGLPQNCDHLYDDSRLTESIGETCPNTSESPIPTCKSDDVSSLCSPNSRLNVKLETVDINKRDSVHYSCCPESKTFDSTQKINSSVRQFQSSKKFTRTDMHPAKLTVTQTGFSHLSDHKSENGHEVKRQETVDDFASTANLASSCSLHGETGISQRKQCAGGNQYLFIQKACDETTMVVYRIIGGLLHAFAKAQHLKLRHGAVSYLQSCTSGPCNAEVPKEKQTYSDDDTCNSVLFHVLDELLPSFSESAA